MLSSLTVVPNSSTSTNMHFSYVILRCTSPSLLQLKCTFSEAILHYAFAGPISFQSFPCDRMYDATYDVEIHFNSQGTSLCIELLLQPKLSVTQLSSAFNCETDQGSLGKLSLGSLAGSFKLGSTFKRPGFTFF